MTRKHQLIIIAFASIVITTIVSGRLSIVTEKELENYKKQQAEYDELKQQSEGFIEMVEGYKSEYNDLVAKYEQTKKDYEKYKEETSTDLNIELEELNKKKEKYANLIKEYTAKLDNN